MSRYSKVLRRMWNDAKFRELSSPPPNGQTLWIRLLTATESTSIPGLFSAWEAGLAQSLKWPVEGFREAFAEVAGKGMVRADWDAGLVWLPNAIQHNRPESPNVVKSWATPWDELPECALKCEAYWALKAFVEGMGKPWGQVFAQAITGPSSDPSPKPSPNQEQEQDQEQEQERERLARDPSGPGTEQEGGEVVSLKTDDPLRPDTPYKLRNLWANGFRDTYRIMWPGEPNFDRQAREFLEDQIGRLPTAEDRNRSVEGLARVVARYFADREASLVRHRHPFKFFRDRYAALVSEGPKPLAIVKPRFNPAAQPR